MTAMAAVTDMQSWSSTYCPQSVSQWNAWPATGRSALQDLEDVQIEDDWIAHDYVRSSRPRSAAPTFGRVVLAGASTPAWCPVYCLHYTTLPTQLQKSTQLKSWHWCSWTCLLPHYDSISCQETSWSNAPLHIFYSQTLNETFIFNGTSHCCDSFLKDVHFTFLLTKNIWQKNKLFLDAQNQLFLG